MIDSYMMWMEHASVKVMGILLHIKTNVCIMMRKGIVLRLLVCIYAVLNDT